MQISEECVNVDRGLRFGESGWYEPYTEDRGALFRACQRKHGRCIGKVYVDRKVAVSSDPTLPAFVLDAVPVGWVFLKRDKYADTHETYLKETWVTLRTL